MKGINPFGSSRAALAGAALVLASAVVYAAAPGWSLQDDRQLTFEGTQAGASFTGTFGTWNADIAFDPAALDESRVAVTIDTASAATGDPTKDGALSETDWFDSGSYPQATFTSSSIREVSAGQYVADGTLSLKGKETPISMPFTVTIKGNEATASGSLTLDRIDLGLGLQADPEAKWVGREVNIKFTTDATRQ